MFWAREGTEIGIIRQSPERVWIDIPLGHDRAMSGFNVLTVSVDKHDLQKAIERWQAQDTPVTQSGAEFLSHNEVKRKESHT